MDKIDHGSQTFWTIVIIIGLFVVAFLFGAECHHKPDRYNGGWVFPDKKK